VIDADALNLLALAPCKGDRRVLTPHPGEAGRLLGISTSEVQDDRLAAARAIVERYGGTVVLKGAGTLVVERDQLPSICDQGNPGMASPGMGDVLTGVIAGIAAQTADLSEAARAGVLVHAMAGDMAARRGERGLLASDLFTYLPTCVNPTQRI
jgi:NAD(P)H-hydrate epimerase